MTSSSWRPRSTASSDLTRRDAVRFGAGALAVTLAASAPTPGAAQDAAATFVLVHGAWGGAWIWRDVIAALRAAGHSVYAATATGMGDRVHLADPAIGLDVYVTDVVNLIEYEDLHDVILVGWSFGGMTISGVAEQIPERLAQVVYLDALVPADGQDAYAAGGRSAGDRAADAVLAEAGGTPGMFHVEPVAAWIRSQVPDQETQDWLFARLTAQPLLTWTTPLQLDNPVAAKLPRTFILCTADKDMQEEPQTDPFVLTAERVRAEPGWRAVELAGNHMVPISDPGAAAEALLALV